MDIKITGTIERIGEVQSFRDGKFQKREVVLVADEPHAKCHYVVEFVQGDAERVGAMAEGEQVECTAEVSAREWKGRWFISLRGVSIDPLAGVKKPCAPYTPPPPAEYVAGLSAAQMDDLPF